MKLRIKLRSRLVWRSLVRSGQRMLKGLRHSWFWGRALVREYSSSQINLRAMSLVYTTFLSLVPLIAIALSVLKGFGWHHVLLPFLIRFVAPMGSHGILIAQRILSFIRRVKASVLGSFGLLLLLYTAVSLLQKVESACNHIWRIRKSRTLLSRFSDYLSVLLIGPVLVFAALGMTAGLLSSYWSRQILALQPFGVLYLTVIRIAPYLLVISAFTFLYMFIPNTRVRLRSAFIGALIAGLSWEGLGWAFAKFAATTSSYTAIYSGFALLLLFMIWLYLSWLIFLLGVEISFLVQNPSALRLHDLRYTLTNREQERDGLLIMYLVAQAYQRRETLWTLANLSKRLFLPPDVVQGYLDLFQENRLLLVTEGDTPGLAPARELSDISLMDVLSSIRGRNPDPHFTRAPEGSPERAVDERLTVLDQVIEREMVSTSLGDWVAESRPLLPAPPAVETTKSATMVVRRRPTAPSRDPSKASG
jgi:membrane protein